MSVCDSASEGLVAKTGHGFAKYGQLRRLLWHRCPVFKRSIAAAKRVVGAGYMPAGALSIHPSRKSADC